ncbi:MAG: DUF429 domain-containing protein [Oscillospiraceae bacterium]|nr:DUF429 domain-containing protein [Oscillospiraceae bacterium]
MELEQMLLFYSFAQIKGVSAGKEEEYWASGQTLGSAAESLSNQQTLFDGDAGSHDVFHSLDALRDGDAAFFQEHLSHKLYYRIAYSFPRGVMFLDIETTGLSTVYHYVTCVGWMLDGKYGCWVQGTDPRPFLDAFRSAKMIVTFNGARFDCKFLDQAFGTGEFSRKANLDLMFLCRRFGLTGGQKEIERAVGFSRPESLREIDGKEAVALWYSFLFGKRSSLGRLIRYNFYDVWGMAYILDWVFFEKIYGHEFPRAGEPRSFFSRDPAPDCSGALPPASACADIRAFVKEHISNFSRVSLQASRPYRVVGIDLAGKPSSRTGLCLLKGCSARTSVAHTDEDILRFVREARPDLISIDAPLSLPKGRTSVYDDDPAREAAGILRYCERELKRRGVNSYPALIRSMQELTRRGIDLARRLRRSGYPVIECFPGAAQDVIQLPRKRTDESLLKAGLSRFGVRGPFYRGDVCHDELDAITASLVGQFFISGFYEPLGIPEENDMIIPQRRHRPEPHELVIGLAGPPAVGKTTVGTYLEAHGFHYVRYSQIIQRELAAAGRPAGRDDLRAAGDSLFHGGGQYDLNRKLALSVGPYPRVVIDGMRHPEDYTFWKERCFLGFVPIYIDAGLAPRRERFALRGNESIAYEEAEAHPAEAEAASLRDRAEHIIVNNGTLEELYRSIQGILPDLGLK